jgi:hypothetical protein
MGTRRSKACSRQLTALQHDGVWLVVGHDAVHDGAEQALVRLVIHAVLLHNMLHDMSVTGCDGHPAVQSVTALIHKDQCMRFEHLACSMHAQGSYTCVWTEHPGEQHSK